MMMIMSHIRHIICYFDIQGLEEFENKIDKLAASNGTSTGGHDDSWLGGIYNKFKYLLNDDDDNQLGALMGGDMEGLEPPVFDDTWGLADDFAVMNGSFFGSLTLIAKDVLRGALMVRSAIIRVHANGHAGRVRQASGAGGTD